MLPGVPYFPAGILTAAVILSACSGGGATPDSRGESASDPVLRELRYSREAGLPTQLLPDGFGSPDYEPPRGRCAEALRDPAREHVRLRLTQQYTRRDRWQQGDTLVTVRYAEGTYEVSPDTSYGLAAGEMLRVNCARQSATAVVSPVQGES
jgi:hypothetical protein